MSVVVHYRTSAAEASTLVEELHTHGCEAWPLQANLAHHDTVGRVVPDAVKLAGRLDLLVNSASVFPGETIEQASFDNLLEAMTTNAWAPFALTRSFATYVGHGQVINLLDSRLTGHDPGHLGYMISKHALAAFTRICAIEYAPDIAVNAVAPGLVLEPIDGSDPGYMARVSRLLPLRRHGDPEDVAAAIVYLAGTTFVTGEVIRVDGGRHLKECGFGQDNN
jgi:pteridine reductase